jgi:hypothetical protein
MFTRLRRIRHRLQVSLVETRRVGGKVCHEHVAGLGPIEVPPSVDARLAFWRRLHQRLAMLSNRISADAQAKILGSVHARIAMVTTEEQRAVQLRNAEADERFWTSLRDMNRESVDGHKSHAALTERAIASWEAAAATAAENAAAARDRVARIRRGEDVPGGLGKPRQLAEDMERIMRQAGWDGR